MDVSAGSSRRAWPNSSASQSAASSTPGRQPISSPSRRLTSPRLGDRRIRPGDELITVAAGFPTTVAPAIQHGVVPVFVDVDPVTDNIDTSMLAEALSPRTKAVMVAHTLGNPFDIDAVLDFCEANGLWLVEDNCDAMGSEYTTRRGAHERHPPDRNLRTRGHEQLLPRTPDDHR